MDEFKMDASVQGIIAVGFFVMLIIPYVIVGLIETGCF